MKKTDLSFSATAQLVDRFAAVTQEQDQAILANMNARYLVLYNQMIEIVEELKRRPGDMRRVLMQLYISPNMHVRLKAAIHTLAVSPTEARRQLELIAEAHWFPQTADASGMLRAIDEGRYTPV